MVRPALDGADDTENQNHKDEVQRITSRKQSLANMTFEDLNPQEKDKLLKALGVRAGLIVDSADS